MNLPIPEIIEGPAILQIGNDYFESREDIALKLTEETDDVPILTRGVVAQRNKGRKVEATFTPVRWSDYSKLFAVLSKTRGQRVFGNTNTTAAIFGADGTKVLLKRAAITAVSSLGLGISKDRFSEFTLTGLADPTSPSQGWEALLTISQAAMPALPALTSADLSSLPFVAILTEDADNPADTDLIVDLEEGAEISFDLKLNERKIDRTGTFDFTMDEFVPSVKFRPSGISISNWQELVSMTNPPRLGGVYAPEYDIVIRGLSAGDPLFKLRKVVCSDRELKWSATESRYSEVELKAMGNLGVNKFEVGTVENGVDATTVA